ncbi:Polyketide synthase PksN [Bacillus velezensis]|nr:Polyketide synthase PksN [Bacillus velezensis]
MEERAVFLVNDTRDLKEKLNDFVKGNENIPGLWRGQAELPELSEPAPETDDPRRLAELWAEGKTVDWNKLYGSYKPRKTSVPTYPFAKERYWIPQQKKQEKSPSGTVLHPLLQENTSDFSQHASRLFLREMNFSYLTMSSTDKKYCRVSPIWKWPQRRSKRPLP